MSRNEKIVDGVIHRELATVEIPPGSKRRDPCTLMIQL